jgi:tetratricopeptide (TPR) repeat protein
LVTGLALAAALAQAPQALLHFERGRALYDLHDDSGEAAELAAKEFRLALDLDPRLSAAVAYLGFLAADAGRAEEARVAYRKALELDPKCAEARVGLARLHMAAVRNRQAIEELRRAVAGHPHHALARRELAAALVHEQSKPTPEMRREAIDCWQVLIRLDSSDRDAHHELAKAYEQLGRWGDAERHYREVLRIGQTPQDLDVWVYSIHGDLARVLERQGRYAEAIREYEAVAATEGAGAEEVYNARAGIARLRKRGQ